MDFRKIDFRKKDLKKIASRADDTGISEYFENIKEYLHEMKQSYDNFVSYVESNITSPDDFINKYKEIYNNSLDMYRFDELIMETVDYCREITETDLKAVTKNDGIIKKLEATVNDLETKLNEMLQNNELLQQEYDKIETNINYVKNEIFNIGTEANKNRYRRLIKKANFEYKDLEHICDILTEFSEQLDFRIRQFLNSNYSIKDAKDDEQRKQNILNNATSIALVNIGKEIDEIVNQIDSMVQSAIDLVNSIDDEVNNKNTQVEELRNAVQTLKDELETASLSHVELQGNVAELNAELILLFEV